MKHFSITDSVLKRPVSVIMATLIVIGFGVFSLTNLKVTLRPSFNIPILAIMTQYEGVAPKDMEDIVVEPLEGAISSVAGIKTISSNINKGSAFIILRLYNGTNVRKTIEEVRAKISRVRGQLPDEVRNPVIFQFDPSNRPIMHLSLKSPTRGLDKLRQLGTDVIQPRLERIKGVASANIRGGLTRTIYINISPQSLAQYNLVPSDIESALRNNNVEIPIGNISTPTNSYSIQALSLYQNVDQIKQTIIKMSPSGVPIRIKDVADVKDAFAKIHTLVEINGENTVSVSIHKKSDANTLSVTSGVKKALPAINESLPPSVKLQIRSNNGKYIQDSISNLAETALISLFVVLIVLIIVMGGWRIAFIVAMTIPVSITASFAGMYALGFTLNTLTISSLALAVGILVDNAIVVSESIARKLEEGVPKFKAALEGTNEVIGALLGATLTTVGIFVPIISLSGIAGQIFRAFAVTLCIAIAISYIASIILVPVLTILLIDKRQFAKDTAIKRFTKRLEEWYVASLRWFMFRKWIAVVVVIGLFFGIVVIKSNLPSRFFSQNDTGSIDVNIELPTGTKLTRTAKIMHQFSQEINAMPAVKTIITNIGSGGFFSQRTNLGSFDIELVNQTKRKVTTQQFSFKLKKMLKSPGVDVRIQGGGAGGFAGRGGGIRLSVIGPDVNVLQKISTRIETLLENDPNIISIDNGRSKPIPQLRFRVNRRRISRLHSTLYAVAHSLKTQVQGTRAGYFRTQDRRVPIMVQVPDEKLNSKTALVNLQLIQSGGQRIPVSSLGHFERKKGVTTIHRRNRQTVMDININVKGNPSQLRPKILSTIKKHVILPEGYRYSFTGSTRQAFQIQTNIQWALLFAVLLAYMIMASLFENFRDPFIIFFTIPMSFFGAFLALFVTNTALASTAFVGIFVLVGVIVNNGIVLVDYIHLYTKRNEYSKSVLDNVLEASKRRMRPILLTALTTSFSMIPLALGLGTGGSSWSPLGKTVIGGLLFGTILTLYILPIFVVGIKKERREAVKKEKKDK